MALQTNLLAYYKMEGNSNDATADGYNGTDTAITYGASYGKINEGANFNGTTSLINLPVIMPNNTTDRTYAGWVNVGSFVANAVIQGSNPQGEGETYVELTSTSFQWIVNTASGYFTLTDPTSRSTGTWYHLGCVVQPASNSMTLYVNGVSVASGNLSGNTSIKTTTGTWYARFGANIQSTPGAYLTGDIDEWGCWDRALSASEISTLYNGGSGITYPFPTSFGSFFLFFNV